MQTKGKARLKALIVEDAPEVARRLGELLAELDGVQIIGPAADGEEALRLFYETSPHVVLLDLQLPQRNGLEVLAAIRACDDQCLIIVLTNFDSADFRDHSLKAGANYFLSKSRDFERVAEIIQNCASG